MGYIPPYSSVLLIYRQITVALADKFVKSNATMAH